MDLYSKFHACFPMLGRFWFLVQSHADYMARMHLRMDKV